MDTNHNRFTSQLFNTPEAAETAYQRALSRGYDAKDINILMSEDSKKKLHNTVLDVETGDKSMEGLAIGGATGGAVVGIASAILAIGTILAFPGLGLVVAGPLAAGLAGAGAGSIAGGLIGALIGWGIPEERARYYEEGINKGGIVLGVNEDPKRPLADDWKL